jgi:Uma2 family endonuclease
VLTWEAYLEEYLREPPTMQPYAIIDGVRILLSTPTWLHQDAGGAIYEFFRQYWRRTRQARPMIAPFDVVISREPLRTRQPDVFLISQRRLDTVGGIPARGPLEIAPELVVEVLSPSESAKDRTDKIADYVRIGVLECWLVISESTSVEVLRLTPAGAETAATYGPGDTVRSLTFDDLTVPVDAIFAD